KLVRPHELPPLAAQAIGQDRVAVEPAEYQGVSGGLTEPRRQSPLELLAAVGLQRLDPRRGHSDGAPPTLPLLDPVLPSPPPRLGLLEAALDLDGASGEINVTPTQRQKLATTGA